MAKLWLNLTAFVDQFLKEEDGDALRESIRVLSQALMESEVAGLSGAEWSERGNQPTAVRNGNQPRTWDTRVGTVELAILEFRPATYFPSLLHPRRRAE